LFSLYISGNPRVLHSFPTRRSSDLTSTRGNRKTSAATSLPPSATSSEERITHGNFQPDTHRGPGDDRWDHQLQRSAGCHTTDQVDRKSTRLNSSHGSISYAVFCLKK